MFTIDRLLLVAALLLIVGIASSGFSSRFGLPGLVLFIVVGMLAGSEGLGGIAFENYTIAHGIGTVSLAIILFDGGLRTSIAAVRPVIGPAFTLATVGVVLTAAITGFAAHAILDLSLLEGMLLGGVIASTDAAAVFAILRNSGLHLPERISSTLETESASNDPMAVFLTIGIIGLITGSVEGGLELGILFLEQMVIGLVAGLVIGLLTAKVLPHVNLATGALYPLFTLGGGLLAFGLTALLGGSGFLAVYVAGIIIGNAALPNHRAILLFHDGLAWLSQIGMFVLMGLVVFPSRLMQVAMPALLIALVLVLVARPVAVLVSVAAFRYSGRELVFLSWAGVRGAVPIVLATYPLLFGVPQAHLIFNVVFFVVLVSVLAQGWSLPLAANLTKLRLRAPPSAGVSLEIASIRHIDADIVDYPVSAESAIAGRSLRELALPEGAVVAMISRAARVIPPRGNTRVEAGDHLFIVVSHQSRAALDKAFLEGGSALRYELLEFALSAAATVADLRRYYGLTLAGLSDDVTLDAALRERLGSELEVGSTLETGGVLLRVRELHAGRITSVGVAILPHGTDESG
jgi:cell volume regulation protein A